MMKKILNNDSLVRDESTQAVLNTDLDSLAKYRLNRTRQRKLDSLGDEVVGLKDEIKELKEIILSLVRERE